jgi:hypothetical protein
MELKEELLPLLERQLASKLRYRTLLFQCHHMPSIQALETSLLALDEFWPTPPLRIGQEEMFDPIGPVSVQRFLQKIRSVEYQQPIVLCGPLHICDCWSGESRRVLWQHLAAFSAGPGIVVVDVPREQDTQGLFRIAGRLGAVDAYYLKSRLTATEDGLV